LNIIALSLEKQLDLSGNIKTKSEAILLVSAQQKDLSYLKFIHVF
jgi:hypothetical protein